MYLKLATCSCSIHYFNFTSLHSDPKRVGHRNRVVFLLYYSLHVTLQIYTKRMGDDHYVMHCMKCKFELDDIHISHY